MHNKVVVTLLIVVLLLLHAGCAAHTHVVGDGAQRGQTIESRQWYVIWGLVPINDVDTNMMAGETSDYSITTEINALDFLINVFLGWITITSRTVTVTR
jgi:hypothetical protein